MPPDFSVPGARLREIVRAVAERQPRTALVFTDRWGEQDRYVARTAWLRCPDTIVAEIVGRGEGRSSLALYIRSQAGCPVPATSRERLTRWLDGIAAAAGTEASKGYDRHAARSPRAPEPHLRPAPRGPASRARRRGDRRRRRRDRRGAPAPARGLSVAVLEARPRLGGRTVTTPLRGHPVDLGAHWLHAGPINPLVASASSAASPARAAQESHLWIGRRPAGGRRNSPSAAPGPSPTGR